MKRTEWVLCPVCGNKTRKQIRTDTELMNRARIENPIYRAGLHIIKEPDTLDAEQMNV